MIEIKNTQVFNFEGAFRGLRNPMNSWEKSDSVFGVFHIDEAYNIAEEIGNLYIQISNDNDNNEDDIYDFWQNWIHYNGISGANPYGEHSVVGSFIGPNDLDLAQRMIKAGSPNDKFMRQILISMDITAPLYW